MVTCSVFCCFAARKIVDYSQKVNNFIRDIKLNSGIKKLHYKVNEFEILVVHTVAYT